MIETLTLSTFTPRIGETFRLDAPSGQPVPIELVEAQSLASDGTRAEGSRRARDPFSLVFKGPPGPALPQGIYALAHDGLEPMDLFLVPIGPGRGGVLYEAVFT